MIDTESSYDPENDSMLKWYEQLIREQALIDASYQDVIDTEIWHKIKTNEDYSESIIQKRWRIRAEEAEEDRNKLIKRITAMEKALKQSSCRCQSCKNYRQSNCIKLHPCSNGSEYEFNEELYLQN